MGKESLSDTELAQRVKDEADEESLKILITRHSPLCYKMYHYYYPALSSLGRVVDNFDREKDYIIYESAMTFDNSKSKFGTWVGKMVGYFCLNQMRNSTKVVSYDNENLRKLIDGSVQTEVTDDNLREYVMNILSRIKDKRIKMIYEMRYFGNGTKNTAWKHIAKKLNVSIQTAINLHNSVQKILKEKLTNKEPSDII